MSKLKNIILLALTVVLSQACSPLKPLPLQEEHVYTLAPSKSGKQPKQVVTKHDNRSQSGAKTLLVTMPKSAPELNAKSMIYSQKPYEIQAFAKHRWVNKPAKMLQPLLVQSIMNNPQLQSVVASPFAGRSDYRLDTEIIDFRQDFSGEQSQFQITLSAHLVDSKSQRIIASRQFTRVNQAVANNPRAGVTAANQAIDKLLEELEQFIAMNV